jgi:cyanate lyase
MAGSTSGCLGQMSFDPTQAAAVTEVLELPTEATALLQQVPHRGSLPTGVPTDPLIDRFYELVSLYGTTFKALTEEEFGDGIMSAIDVSTNLEREPHEAGLRVRIAMSEKFLAYKQY